MKPLHRLHSTSKDLANEPHPGAWEHKPNFQFAAFANQLAVEIEMILWDNLIPI
jgi:hypothetical protein